MHGDNRFLFYQIMLYPIPKEKDFFSLVQDYTQIWVREYIEDSDEKFSFETKDSLMAEYISFINKYWWLYRSFPFVKAIYLCNSITFNALKDGSDIDLFIVVKNWKLWTARLFTVLLTQIFWLRWYKKKKWKKFDLWFYITDENINLYSFTQKPIDIYFAYWIAHLVPLYMENQWYENYIYRENSWINNLITNHPLDNIINLWNKIFYWNNWFKRFFEKIFWWKIWNHFERFIKYVWMPIVLLKKKKLWKISSWTVISDDVLKFYWSKVNKIVNLKFKLISKYEE